VSLDTLIHECKSNNRKAQEQLFRLLSPKLFCVCVKYSRNHEEAQDNLQDGFLLILNKINQFDFKGSFEGWAKRVMINNILQKYRTENVLEIINENFPEIVDVELDEETISMDFLVKIIQELPDKYRLVFNLYVLDNYSHKEIAKMLNISEGTSKSNLSRARGILKEKLENKASNELNEAK
jgi:RNA polymerase sigma factor (sigma-70 family)